MRIPRGKAKRVFDVLVQFAKVPLDLEQGFIFYLSEQGYDNREFRVGGRLGHGGKFKTTLSRWYVDYYPEDATADREQRVKIINYFLKQIRESVVD